jgi:hypothetical protein
MIQLGRKLSLIFIIVCFCFFPIIEVSGQGVTIDFSSLNSGGIQFNTMSWGNTNNPSSQPTTSVPATLTTPTSTSTGTATTTYSSTQTQTTNSGMTTSTPKCNPMAGQSPYNPIDPTELTKELIRPVTFSALPENEPLLPNAEQYIVTVCLSGCSDKVTTTEQASGKLAGILLNRYFYGSEARPFRVVFTSITPMDQQKQLLYQIEIQAGSIVESRIFKTGGRFIKEYQKITREEAEIGVNWSHTSKDDKSVHDFYTKKAFNKFYNIAIQEKNLSSKNFNNN